MWLLTHAEIKAKPCINSPKLEGKDLSIPTGSTQKSLPPRGLNYGVPRVQYVLSDVVQLGASAATTSVGIRKLFMGVDIDCTFSYSMYKYFTGFPKAYEKNFTYGL